MVVTQSLSHVQLFVTPWTAECQARLPPSLGSLLRFTLIELVMPSNHLILCCPLLLLPSIFPSIRVFSSESALRIRWPKYWSFNLSISEYSGLISFRIDWFDFIALQGTLKSPDVEILDSNHLPLKIIFKQAVNLGELNCKIIPRTCSLSMKQLRF